MVDSDREDVVVTTGLTGPFPSAALILCEHASNRFPARIGDLGLSDEAKISHAAWDPGALALATGMARHLRAPLVAATVSRLIYDCNRPPEAADAVPATSERFDIPGNRDLKPADRAARARAVYEPFSAEVSRVLDLARPQALVTIHTFTPVYFGQPREVEIGILHDSDTRLADHVLDATTGGPWKVMRNQPYGPADGVTHSLRKHALARGLANVMIEVRNDLVADAAGLAAIGAFLNDAVQRALAARRDEASAAMHGTDGAA
ncbi:MAG: N-formylglutamate amidohydrolase [Rhodobacteraceae bacterium]|nr:N-formylglutamate amidohydrolase [Paracoccaceae bacterium]